MTQHTGSGSSAKYCILCNMFFSSFHRRIELITSYYNSDSGSDDEEAKRNSVVRVYPPNAKPKEKVKPFNQTAEKSKSSVLKKPKTFGPDLPKTFGPDLPKSHGPDNFKALEPKMQKTCSPELTHNHTAQTIGPKLQEEVSVLKSVDVPIVLNNESVEIINNEIETSDKILPAVLTKIDIDFSEDVGIDIIKNDAVETGLKLEVNGDVSESIITIDEADVDDLKIVSVPEKSVTNDAQFLQVGTKCNILIFLQSSSSINALMDRGSVQRHIGNANLITTLHVINDSKNINDGMPNSILMLILRQITVHQCVKY